MNAVGRRRSFPERRRPTTPLPVVLIHLPTSIHPDGRALGVNGGVHGGAFAVGAVVAIIRPLLSAAGDPAGEAGADKALVHLCDLAGRLRGTGFLAYASGTSGTLLTSHEAADGPVQLVLHAHGDQTGLVEAPAITPLPELGLALVAIEGLAVPRCRSRSAGPRTATAGCGCGPVSGRTRRSPAQYPSPAPRLHRDRPLGARGAARAACRGSLVRAPGGPAHHLGSRPRAAAPRRPGHPRPPGRPHPARRRARTPRTRPGDPLTAPPGRARALRRR